MIEKIFGKPREKTIRRNQQKEKKIEKENREHYYELCRLIRNGKITKKQKEMIEEIEFEKRDYYDELCVFIRKEAITEKQKEEIFGKRNPPISKNYRRLPDCNHKFEKYGWKKGENREKSYYYRL